MKFIKIDNCIINLERINYFVTDKTSTDLVFIHFDGGEYAFVKSTLVDIETAIHAVLNPVV